MIFHSNTSTWAGLLLYMKHFAMSLTSAGDLKTLRPPNPPDRMEPFLTLPNFSFTEKTCENFIIDFKTLPFLLLNYTIRLFGAHIRFEHDLPFCVS